MGVCRVEKNDKSERKGWSNENGRNEREKYDVLDDEGKEQADKMNWSEKLGRKRRQEVQGLLRHPGEICARLDVRVRELLAGCHGSCHFGQITILTHLGSNPSGSLIKPLSCSVTHPLSHLLLDTHWMGKNKICLSSSFVNSHACTHLLPPGVIS